MFGSKTVGNGREKPGMVAMYLLMRDDGKYLASGDPVRYTDDWSMAMKYFGAVGLLRLKEYRDKVGGTIMIVNSYLPERYYNQ